MDLQANKAGIYPIYQKPAHAIGLSAPPPPPIGCVLYMPGLPGAGNKIYDRSPYGNHGTITGAIWTRLPSGLWCLDFDGTDDIVNCGSGASLDSLVRKTIIVWIYPEGWGEGGGGTLGLIADKSNFSNTGWFLRTLNDSSDKQINYYHFFDNTVGNWKVNNAVDLNGWYCVAITYDNSSDSNDPIFYIKGEARAISSGAGSASGTAAGDASDNLLIGNNAATTATFDGYIALPRVYNRILSALEIQNHFNREKHLFGVW